MGYLTAEDVPPVAVGGRKTVLTCKPCNNGAGTEFDAHAATRSDIELFAQRISNRPMPVTVHAAGIPLRGTVQWSEGVLQLFGVPAQNDPRVQEAHVRAWDHYVDSKAPSPDLSFTIQMGYSETRARISWIRAAYLAAFAGRGWPYIFRDALQPIRDQLARPEEEVIPTYLLRSPGVAAESRGILLVDDPHELRCVAVIMGPTTVFLPGMRAPLTCFELVDAFLKRRGSGDQLAVDLNGEEVPWPTNAIYLSG